MAVSTLDVQAWWQGLPSGVVVALVTIAMPLLLTYLTTLWNSTSLPPSNSPLKRPRTVPYMLPYLGHSLTYAMRGRDFLQENAFVEFIPFVD